MEFKDVSVLMKKNLCFPKYLLNLSVNSVEEFIPSLPVLANTPYTHSLLQRINFTIENILFHSEAVLQILQVSYLKNKYIFP